MPLAKGTLPLHSSDENIPVIRHQTNIKPNEHSYLILQTLPNDFLLHSCRLELTCRLDLSPGIAIGCWLSVKIMMVVDHSVVEKCCCQFGQWILTAVDVLLQWGLLLSCLPPAPPPASQFWPDAREAMSAPACTSVARVATLYFPCCNTLCQPRQAITQVRRRNQEINCVGKLYFSQRNEEYIEETNNSFEEERPSESIKCTLRRFSDPTKKLTTSQSTFSVRAN